MSWNQWTSDELRVLAANYETHGCEWAGWESLLPGRTAQAIRKQAVRLGLRVTPEVKQAKSVKRKRAFKEKPDPFEREILKLLDRGMTTSEIDKLMKWTPGKCKLVLTSRWRREKEKELAYDAE